MYGADVAGSIFDENIPWNLSEIDSILKYIENCCLYDYRYGLGD